MAFSSFLPHHSLDSHSHRARLFSSSLESAIYLLSSICSVPQSISVLPAINTNFTHHISAGLANGTVITGQNAISHPSAPTALPTTTVPPQGQGQTTPCAATTLRAETEESDNVEDANLPGTLPSLRKPAINFSKTMEEDLPARIARLWYINPYGAEMRFPANPHVLDALGSASCIVYSIGSLFTSIIPSLILRGVGAAVANPGIRNKILILNGSIDRETGPSSQPFSAMDFVAAIADACAESRGLAKPSEDTYWHYVTHVIYLECAGAPAVDREGLTRAGIEALRLYGQKGRYDAKALNQALEMVMGRGDGRAATRRNTLER